MAIESHNFVWQQGEDGEINMRYTQDGLPIDLTGYSLRMDVRNAAGAVVFTFNSTDVSGGGAIDTIGTSDNEATLGSDGTIHIVVPRTASLEGGGLATSIGVPLKYDVFLRDASNIQHKILKGTITFEESQTQWT